MRLRLESKDINVGKEVKFLGLDLNYKLTWTNHVNKKVTKMRQSIKMLRNLQAENIKSNISMHLCKTMIRAFYMYANASCANVTKTDLNKKQREQNDAIILAYNLPMWTSIDELNHKNMNPKNSKQRTIQKLSSEYHASATKQNKEIINIGEKHWLTWTQIMMYQTSLQKIL